MAGENKTYIVTTFYKFVVIKDCDEMKLQLKRFCTNNQILGTILLAEEGVNSTIIGSREAINSFYAFMESIPEFTQMEYKESVADNAPFKKLKVKIKPEIVTFNMPMLDASKVGKHLNAEEWDEIISRKDAIVIDCRNDYEVVFGTFKNAIDPKTRKFTELPDWIERNVPADDKNIPIAMFCTGGVRCEKSTAYMRSLGYENVYHLKGCILQYLEERKDQDHLWQGKCFVFDDRIMV